MTSPPEEIEVVCPDCGQKYVDWYCPSLNLSLDNFDDDYLEEASTKTCPRYGVKYDLGTLFAGQIVEGGPFGRCNRITGGHRVPLFLRKLFVNRTIGTDFHRISKTP